MYTRHEILAQLRAMQAPQDSIVLMHCSLRSVGPVEGGAEALLDTLIDYFTAKGGLFCVPTHTWNNIGKNKPTLDLTVAESNLGYLTTLAAGDPRAVRTDNPCHSMAVFGERAHAERFAAGEDRIETPIAPESCYGKICEMGGRILLCGVGQERNTYLHTVEEIVGIPERMLKEFSPLTVRKKDGSVETRHLRLFNEANGDVSLRFPKYETAFRYHRAITDGYIGNAPAQLCDARIMRDVVEMIYKNGGKDPLADERQIAPALYCK